MAEGIQETTRNKYKLIAKAQKLKHGELMSHVANHMMGCTDPDCDVCSMGQDGDMIDNDDEGKGSPHNYGSRSSKEYSGEDSNVDRKGSSVSSRGADASHKVKNRSEAEFGAKGGKANLVNIGDSIKKASFKILRSRR